MPYNILLLLPHLREERKSICPWAACFCIFTLMSSIISFPSLSRDFDKAALMLKTNYECNSKTSINHVEISFSVQPRQNFSMARSESPSIFFYVSIKVCSVVLIRTVNCSIWCPGSKLCWNYCEIVKPLRTGHFRKWIVFKFLYNEFFVSLAEFYYLDVNWVFCSTLLSDHLPPLLLCKYAHK